MGLGQLQDARGVLIAAVEAVLVLSILEMLWLQSNSTWIETYVDFASVYAAALVPEAKDAAGAAKPKHLGFLHRFRTYRVCERYAAFANALT